MSRSNGAAPGIEVVIPGRKLPMKIEHIVFDFNGTLAVDGRLVHGVEERLRKLAELAEVVVMTADTFGSARQALADLPAAVRIVRDGTEKQQFVQSVGTDTVAAIGNGTNDVPMLRAAVLGIAVIGDEGTSGELLQVAAIIVHHINDAFDLLLNPQRLIATLRH